MPSSVPSSRPSGAPTITPTVDPTPMLIIVPSWIFGIGVTLCVIGAMIFIKSLFVPNINKVKILAMVNEVLEEEDTRRDESKDSWERTKPKFGRYMDDNDEHY